MTTKLLEVKNIKLSILKSNPPQLSITATGTARTDDWDNYFLVPYQYIVPPVDGIYDFDFVGIAPTDASADVIVPAVTTRVWPAFPSNLKGVRIHASLNSMEVMLDNTTHSVEFD